MMPKHSLCLYLSLLSHFCRFVCIAFTGCLINLLAARGRLVGGPTSPTVPLPTVLFAGPDPARLVLSQHLVLPVVILSHMATALRYVLPIFFLVNKAKEVKPDRKKFDSNFFYRFQCEGTTRGFH